MNNGELGSAVVPMFMGTYTPKLDDKGRLFLPAKFREQLAEGLVVTRGQDRCLTIWTLPDFARLNHWLHQQPITRAEVRSYIRMLFATATKEVPDKQGRINIPSSLRTYASLGREVRVVGAMNTVEIWDPAAWDAYSTAQADAFADLSDDLFPGTWAPTTP